MKDSAKQDATTRADNLDDPTAQDTGRLPTGDPGPAYPNHANDSRGKGSPYGGTKTADADAPDANQQVNREDTANPKARASCPRIWAMNTIARAAMEIKGTTSRAMITAPATPAAL